jgi:hypothetical protein
MGTNYYAEPGTANEKTTRFLDEDGRLHIGKSSMGWKFGFRAHPELDLTSWTRWKNFLTDVELTGGRIVNEYGDEVTLIDLKEIVQNRIDSRFGEPDCRIGLYGHAGSDWHDPEGHDFHVGDFS